MLVSLLAKYVTLAGGQWLAVDVQGSFTASLGRPAEPISRVPSRYIFTCPGLVPSPHMAPW